MGYLEMIAENKHILTFSYNGGRGNFTIDIDKATEVYKISDLKKLFSIAPEKEIEITETFYNFTSAKLEYEKSFSSYSRNTKLIEKLQKIVIFLSETYGFYTEEKAPEKITKKKGDGLLFFSLYSGDIVEIASGTFFKISDIWFFISKKKEIKKGGYTITVPAYGSTVGTMHNSEKSAIYWIISSGIIDILKNPEEGRREKLQIIRENFLKAVENSGFSWIIEKNPEFFKDFLTAEAPQENMTEAEKTAEKTAEKAEEKTTQNDLTPEEQTEKPTAYIDRIGVKKVKKLYMYRLFRKAPKKAKYNALRAYSKSPYAIYLQKNGFHVTKCPYTDHKAKISMFSGDTSVGFYTGFSPPWGVSKNFTLKFAAKNFQK